MPRYPDPISMGKSMLGPQTRRDFLKRLVGAAASAAMPKLPEAPAAVPSAPAVKFVEDPRLMSGFTGLSTRGKSEFGPRFWLSDYPEMQGLDASQARSLIKQKFNLNPDEPENLPWSLTEGVPAYKDTNGKIGYYEYNNLTRKWHPVVAMPADDGGLSYRHLDSGSAVPETAIGFDEAYGDNPPRYEPWWMEPHPDDDYYFSTPGEMSNHLMDDWRRDRMWQFREKGPNKDDLARDPELRRDYLRSAAERGIVHGTRFEPLAGLTDSREVPLPIEQPRQPYMSKARKAAAAAPFLAVPLLAPREEKE